MIEKHTKFCIVGLGLIGGSYAQALKSKGYFVMGIDHDQETLQIAQRQCMIDKGSVDGESLIQEADFVIFALYPKTMIAWMQEFRHLLKKGTFMSDVSGVKLAVVEAMQDLCPEGVHFLASHPMAGKEHCGILNSDANIFKGANFIITPSEQNLPDEIETLKQFASILGFSHISVLSCRKHDEMIGYVSQLTHVIAVSLMNANNDDHLNEYSGDSFRDLTRIAKINDTLWSELFVLNQDFLIREIDDFVIEVQRLKQSLIDQDEATLKTILKKANTRRLAFDQALTPIADSDSSITIKKGVNKRTRNDFSSIGFAMLTYLLLPVFFSVGFILCESILLRPFFSIPFWGGEAFEWFLQIVIMILNTFVCIALFKMRLRVQIPSFKKPTNTSHKQILGTTFLGLGISYLCSIGTLLITAFLALMHIVPSTPDFSPSPSLLSNCFLILATCVIAPIFEELFFRGLLLQALRRYGSVFAIITTSLLFALSHGNIIQGIPVFFFSLILSYSCLKSESLYPSIFMHFVLNASAMLFSFIPETSFLTYLISLYVIVLLLLAMFKIITTRKQWWSALRQFKKETSLFAFFKTGSTFTFLLIALFITILSFKIY